MVFDPGVPGPGAPRARLLIFGGWRSPTSLADPAKLLVVGVGSESAQPPVWRELTPEGQAPPARAWHAMTPKWRDSGSDEREYFMFGGESGSRDSAATPVPPAVWMLERPDVSLADGDRYEWSQLPITGQGPSGRSRPAMAYSADGGTLVVVGGDTTGTALPGGQTNAIWTMQGLYYYYNDILTWRRPYERHFHPAPPPIAGMGLVAIGGNRARIARSLERFTLRGNTATGAECGPLLGQWETVTTPDPESARPIADYPNIYVLPDGRLFNAGPPVSMDTRRSRSRYKRFFDLGSRRWEDEPGADQVDTTFFGTSVMVRPGVILRAGNSDGTGTGETQTIDMSHGRWPKWRDYHPAQVRPELVARTHHNLTLLPTGDVLATGGVGTDDDVVGTAVKAPQIWYAKDERWSDPHPASGEALAPDPRVRNYHSTAVLLPDARILTAGGEHPASDEDQMSASVFEPPYLFRANGSYAPRPRARSAPGALIYGGVFTLQLADTARVRTIRSVALMRPGAATHGFDQGQRYVPLEFVAEPSPPRLLVRSPADANLAPPGDYMLFVVDRVGVDAPAVPSVARWVRVLASAPAPVDSADVTAPRGGAWLGLRDSVAIDDGPGTPPVRLVWRAPADDDTLQFTGRARAYDLRYAPDAGAPADFGR